MVTTRIQTTRRRLDAGRHSHGRRRLTAWPLLASAASGAAAERLGLTSQARVYTAGAGLLVLIVAYLMIGAQATKTSYDLDRLKDQNTQLVVQQGELRAQDAHMHTQAGVAQAAAATGLEHSNALQYVAYQPVALDLSAPIGPGRPDDTPLWQRILTAVTGGR